MTILTNTSVSLAIMARVEATLKTLRAERAQRRLYRQTLAELTALNARELADLGLAHQNLSAIARKAVYGA